MSVVGNPYLPFCLSTSTPTADILSFLCVVCSNPAEHHTPGEQFFPVCMFSFCCVHKVTLSSSMMEAEERQKEQIREEELSASISFQLTSHILHGKSSSTVGAKEDSRPESERV